MLTQYYTATTLDGFIADPNNSLDWLFTRQQDPDAPLRYETFIREVGALAMGSTTYEWILDHEFKDKDPSEWKWPYEIPGWVFTHRELPVVPKAPIEFVSGDVAPVHERMAAAAECVRFERESFGALHQMMSGLGEDERERVWDDIGSTLQAYETEQGFVGPCELHVVSGSR